MAMRLWWRSFSLEWRASWLGCGRRVCNEKVYVAFALHFYEKSFDFVWSYVRIRLVLKSTVSK